MIIPTLHPSVWDEAINGFTHFGALLPQIALGFESNLYLCLERIYLWPDNYRVRRHGVRFARIQYQFSNWYVLYFVHDGQPVILGLRHAKRRPFYFQNRNDPAKPSF